MHCPSLRKLHNAQRDSHWKYLSPILQRYMFQNCYKNQQKMVLSRWGKTTGTKSAAFIASTTLIKPQKSKKPVGTVRHVWAPMVKCTHCVIRKPEESASSSTLSMDYHPNNNICLTNFIIYSNSSWLTTDSLCYMELWKFMSLCYDVA